MKPAVLWKKILAVDYRRIWKRLLFLTTFFFASAAFTLSVVVWVQRKPPASPSPAATPLPTPTIPAGVALPPTPSASPAPSSAAGVSLPPPQEEPSPAVASAPSPTPQISFALIVPVAGIKSSQLRDTFTEARSEGRVHNAQDIMAARDTPVLAATRGKIVKLFSSARGGITIYQLSGDEKIVLYYAHLARYADGLAEGHVANQGEVIGYVGDTGNAGAGNYHLHFAMWSVTDPKRYWDGVNINPYPLLRDAQSR
jgi:murein DD-endopeptidase MepM/ murein hydrolase activator NlpD